MQQSQLYIHDMYKCEARMNKIDIQVEIKEEEVIITLIFVNWMMKP